MSHNLFLRCSVRLFAFIFPIVLLGCKPAIQSAATATNSKPSITTTFAQPKTTTTSTPATTHTPTPVPSKTPRPTPTQRPTKTPKPSPTLPITTDIDCIPTDSERISGVVSRVIDGDTIKIQVGHEDFNVRYIGIDTPETWPPPEEYFGHEATQRNRDLVGGKRITLVRDPKTDNRDTYGRLLRFVISDDIFVNAQLVKEGFARYYTSPNSCGKIFYQAEQAARDNRIGLWAPKP